MKNLLQLALSIVLLQTSFVAHGQIEMEPTTGPYGVQIQTLDVIGESVFINSIQAIYYKADNATDWVKIDYPTALPLFHYNENIKGEDEKYYLRDGKDIYVLNTSTLQWDHLATLDFYPEKMQIASDGSAMYIADYNKLMYAASDFQFTEVLDLEEYYEDNFQEAELFEINALLIKGDLFMVNFGDSKNYQSFISYYQGGSKIGENMVNREIYQPQMDLAGNLYYDANGISKYDRITQAFSTVEYNGAKFSAVREFFISKNDRIHVNNNREYVFSDDLGQTWTTYAPYGFISSHRKHRFFEGNGDEVILCGSRGYNTTSIEKYNAVTGERLEIETHFAEPRVENFKVYDDFMIANNWSDDSFISYDDGLTWTIIAKSDAMDNLHITYVNEMYYSADYNGLFRSVDLMTWEKIENFTTHSYDVGFNNELVCRANDNVMIYDTETGTNVKFQSKGIIHPNGNLYFRQGNEFKTYDPITNTETILSDIGSIGSSQLFIDKNGLIIILDYGSHETAIWASVDNGLNFEKRSSLPDDDYTKFLIANDHFFMVDEERILISADKGYSWIEQTAPGIENTPDAYIIDQDNYLYYGMPFNVVHKSKDPLDLTSRISGIIYHDENLDCEFNDAVTVRNQKLKFTNINGEALHTVIGNSPFDLLIPVVNYDITHEVNNALWTSCQPTYNFDATNPSPVEIGVQSSEDCSQFDVQVNNLFLRRCFDNMMSIKVCNTGSIAAASDATIEMTMDPFMDLIAAAPQPSAISGQTLTFDIGNLDPFDCTNMYIDFNLNCNSMPEALHCVQTVVQNSLSCTTDNELQIKVLCAHNVGSYDPNDMHAIISNTLYQEKEVALSTSDVSYLIRFQNTGTDTAFTVRLETELDDRLDYNSIEVTNYSHPYIYKVDDMGNLTVTFNNILLPHEDVNEVASHGYFEFKLDLLSALNDGDKIEGQTGIFFDFNDAVITNEVILEAKIVSDVADVKDNVNFSIYPNPFEQAVMLQFGEVVSGSIEVVDLFGKTILKDKVLNSTTHELLMMNYHRGVYMITFENDTNKTVQMIQKN